MIIGLTGRAGSGKTTAAHLFTDHGFTRDAYARTMKEAVSVMFGVPLEILCGDITVKSQVDPYWGITYRHMLQQFGTEACRNTFGGDIWEKVLWRRYDDYKNIDLVIDDVRFPNEAESILMRDGIIIEISRKGCVEDNHASEKPLPSNLITARVYNNRRIYDLHQAICRYII